MEFCRREQIPPVCGEQKLAACVRLSLLRRRNLSDLCVAPGAWSSLCSHSGAADGVPGEAILDPS